VNVTVKFMSTAAVMYHYVHVKVAYDNFHNKRRWWWCDVM